MSLHEVFSLSNFAVYLHDLHFFTCVVFVCVYSVPFTYSTVWRNDWMKLNEMKRNLRNYNLCFASCLLCCWLVSIIMFQNFKFELITKEKSVLSLFVVSRSLWFFVEIKRVVVVIVCSKCDWSWSECFVDMRNGCKRFHFYVPWEVMGIVFAVSQLQNRHKTDNAQPERASFQLTVKTGKQSESENACFTWDLSWQFGLHTSGMTSWVYNLRVRKLIHPFVLHKA